MYICTYISTYLHVLCRYADSGEPMDVLPIMYDYTMDVVGKAAFGLDLKGSCSDTLNNLDDLQYEHQWWEKYPLDSPEFSRHLLRSAVVMMRSMDIANTTMYIPLVRVKLE